MTNPWDSHVTAARHIQKGGGAYQMIADAKAICAMADEIERLRTCNAELARTARNLERVLAARFHDPSADCACDLCEGRFDVATALATAGEVTP